MQNPTGAFCSVKARSEGIVSKNVGVLQFPKRCDEFNETPQSCREGPSPLKVAYNGRPNSYIIKNRNILASPQK